MKRSGARIVAFVAAAAVAATLAACNAEEPLVPAKGVYRGPTGQALSPETERALSLRSRHQNYN